ncbi:MAG: sigma-54-dependent Fis family transcriptional regulator [Planctomycetales bacterium]|nr:sigma-54-dependent Fis family transcriptional regulator [Planctomycetales bacterium]
MAPSRATSNRLLRLLRSAPLPIYFLAPDRTILFCNQSLADWVGIESESIVGYQLDYDAAGVPDGPASELSGLAPAPDAMAGRKLTGWVCRETNNRLIYRRAHYLSLGEKNQPGGLIVVVDGEDLSTLPLDIEHSATSEALHEQIRQFRLRQQSRFALSHLLGNDPAIQRARRGLRAAIACQESVLVTGPPGSGRSHVARTIHYGTADESFRFLPLACELLDSETLRDALARQLDQRTAPPGPITLMLADVDMLPLDAQLLLSQQISAANARLRLISTAREPLLELAAHRDRFRHDLAMQLTTIEIRLPALHDRLGDLPLLAQAFLEAENRTSPHQVGSCSPETLALLARHVWPGNLDELHEVIRSAHESCQTTTIEPKDLSLRVRQAAFASGVPAAIAPSFDLEAFLARIELEAIERALRQARGNKTKAAELLGMTRPRFYRRLEQLGLSVDEQDDNRRDDEFPYRSQ